ncbi:hypothetical protein A8990_1735 [Paenibacillus taihuensis]|uniref:Uncharacterized protein n=1 Tax=Paenibacillus taihuensis TaxID=1156355 RepID=A0A3D9PXT8_9BACL|nr:hypothetical protein A8990_1735 [Paenibacillus taihuensis]
MEHDKEIQELKERLGRVENQLQNRSHSFSLSKFIIGFIVVFVLMLITIGVVQYIASS